MRLTGGTPVLQETHMTQSYFTNVTAEWSFTASRPYDNPFSDVDVDVIVTGPGRREWRVPAFWAGGRVWRMRFAAPTAGTYKFRTECTNAADAGLHGVEGAFTAAKYKGENPLYRHGRFHVDVDGRHFVHADGTPFFWLGDTWWMGLTDRLKWRKEFPRLLADRVDKGFTVVQIIAGLYPDMDWQDPRGKNEAGLPYDADFSHVNPKWYDFADRKLFAMTDAGIAPCLVGCWGYFAMWMGVEKARRHWRYLVARYGSLPVFWCLAGEETMPFYTVGLGENADPGEARRHAETQQAIWTEVARDMRMLDPFHNPVTLHPGMPTRDCVGDDSLVDFSMVQTGHSGFDSMADTLRIVREEYARRPAMPVVQSEVNYEGICGLSKDDVQRGGFWLCLLNGVAGFTYGANGLWQLNRADQPYGPSPHGATWGNRTWDQAMNLPGSGVLGRARRLLERYSWWKLQPCPERFLSPPSPQVWQTPQIAGIEGKLLIAYLHASKAAWVPADWGRLGGFEPGATYRARWIDPEFDMEYPIPNFIAGTDGQWTMPYSPIIGSILLVVERVKR